MKPIIKIIFFIIVIILGVVLLSTSSYYNYGNTWVISWTGSILYMLILLTSNYIKSYKGNVLYLVNNTISILVMYFLLSNLLFDKETAIAMMLFYIFSTSRALNKFVVERRKKKLKYRR